MAAEAASQLAMAMLWSRETLPTLAADPRFFRAFKDMRRNASPQQTLTELGSKKGAGRVAGDAGIMSRGNASDHVEIGIDGIGQGSEIGPTVCARFGPHSGRCWEALVSRQRAHSGRTEPLEDAMWDYSIERG